MELTKQERQKIAIEEMNEEPLMNLIPVAISKIAKMAIESEAVEGEAGTEATIDGKRYKIKAIITFELI